MAARSAWEEARLKNKEILTLLFVEQQLLHVWLKRCDNLVRLLESNISGSDKCHTQFVEY